MKPFLSKLTRFFWSWGFLKFCLLIVTIIILFYVEEDWRGARAWAAAKAEWEAAGESFDYSRLVPPPVPEAENFAALPLFKLTPDPEKLNKWSMPVLGQAWKNDPAQDVFLAPRGNWQEGQLKDMAKTRDTIRATYTKAFKTEPLPTVDSTGQLDALFPMLADLREASAQRSYCRFEQEYPPRQIEALLTRTTPLLKLSRILTLHAVVALHEQKSALALADIQTNLKLASGLQKEPFLISNLVAIGMTAVSFQAVYEGLALHSWSDAQLTEVQNELAAVDFLPSYQRSLQGELLGILLPLLESAKVNHALMPRVVKIASVESARPDAGVSPTVWPDGWVDFFKSRDVEMNLRAGRLIDLKKRLVFPTSVEREVAELDKQSRSWTERFSWNWMVTSPAMITTARHFAFIQVLIDEARIACGLERYRLAHGNYPESLGALVPACLPELPHDIMNGQPYHYRSNADGTFTLYSVGWNQKDDGGKIIKAPDSPSLETTEGDWVWPAPNPSQSANK
jgi:hypothetical protein